MANENETVERIKVVDEKEYLAAKAKNDMTGTINKL